MKPLRQFRLEANMSQAAIATILKISRSQVNMSERGERPLSDDASERLRSLQEAHEKSESPAAEKRLAASETDEMLAIVAAEICKDRLIRIEWRISKLQKQLKRMKVTFAYRINESNAYFHAAESMQGKKVGKPERALFADIQSKVEQKFPSCSRAAQLKLQISMNLLKAERDLLKQYINPATAIEIKELLSEE